MSSRLSACSGSLRSRQRGATLLVGLIMLLLLTLHALASHTTGSTQLRIVGNMNERQSARAAASEAIEQVLSSSEFVTRTAAVAAAQVDVDTDGQGSSDFRVTVIPTCTAALPVRALELDPDSADDRQCVAGTAFGGSALCVTSHWNLQAVAVAAPGRIATGVTTEVNQGAAVRLDSGEARTFC